MTIAPPGPSPSPSRRPPPRLPGPIRGTLRRVDRRLRLAAAMGGLGASLGVSAALAAAAMGLDFLRPLPDPARWAAWLACVGAASALLLAAVFRPLIRRAPRDALAAVAERALPGGDETLAAAVALIDDGDRAHGSPELIAALIDRAAAEAGAIDARRAVPMGRARLRLAAGLAAAALLALPSALAPDPFARLALRLIAPWSDPGTAGRLAIAVEPGDALVARGDALEVSAAVRARVGRSAPESARIEWTDASGASHSLAMGPGTAPEPGPSGDAATRHFAITLPALDAAITYRVAAGADRTRPFRVAVADPPRIASHRWTIAPPPYTGVEPETADDPAGLVAWEGSLVTVAVATDRPARRVVLDWPGRVGPVELLGDERGLTWSAEVRAAESGPFALAAEDAHGLRGRSGPSGSLHVRPDSPPVVALGEAAEVAGPDGALVLPVAARDDLAVVAAELHYEVDRAEPAAADGAASGAVPLALDGLGSPAARGLAALDLAPLGLGDGDAVSVRVRVVDNRPPPLGPNEAWSRPRSVTIVADVARYEADRLDEALRPIRRALEELARRAAEDRLRLGPLRAAAEASRRDPRRWADRQGDDLDRLAESARGLVDRLRSLAGSLESDPTLGPLAGPIREAAEAEPESARAALDGARDAGDSAARADDLRRAEQDLAEASRRLDDLSDQLDELARAAAARPELAELARRESLLADRADALADRAAAEPDAAEPDAAAEPDDDLFALQNPAIDPGALDELREAQEQLSRALSELIRRAPKLGEAAESARAEADAASRDLRRSDDPAQDAESARRAAESMRRAAEQLRRASGPADPAARAEQLARMLADPESAPPPTDREPSAPPPGASAVGAADPDADLDLRSDRRWGSLPGHLRTELLRASPDRYHPDYAPLIRLYFEEIARSSSSTPPPPPPAP